MKRAEQLQPPTTIVTAKLERVELVVDPARRRRIGAALLRLLNSTGNPEQGGPA